MTANVVRCRRSQLAFSYFSSSSLLPGIFPPELPRRPGAPSRRRRPSLVKSGRRRRDGAPGPLISSRAEAEAVFPFALPSSSSSSPSLPCISPRAPGPLVSSRAEAEAVFPISLSLSLPIHPVVFLPELPRRPVAPSRRRRPSPKKARSPEAFPSELRALSRGGTVALGDHSEFCLTFHDRVLRYAGFLPSPGTVYVIVMAE